MKIKNLGDLFEIKNVFDVVFPESNPKHQNFQKRHTETQTHLWPLDGSNVTVHPRLREKQQQKKNSENLTTRHLCVLLIIMTL